MKTSGGRPSGRPLFLVDARIIDANTIAVAQRKYLQACPLSHSLNQLVDFQNFFIKTSRFPKEKTIGTQLRSRLPHPSLN